MKNYNKVIGSIGEDIATKFLKKNKYKIIENNFKCKLGEIDIIAKDGDYLVFVEVKTRKSTKYGMPSEAVNYYKQQKIIQVAKYYLMNKSLDANVRFDVIEIIIENKHKPTTKWIRIIKNAFNS